MLTDGDLGRAYDLAVAARRGLASFRRHGDHCAGRVPADPPDARQYTCFGGCGRAAPFRFCPLTPFRPPVRQNLPVRALPGGQRALYDGVLQRRGRAHPRPKR